MGLDEGGGGEIAPGPHIAIVVLLLSLVIPVETLQDWITAFLPKSTLAYFSFCAWYSCF